ncbi:phytochrome-like protein cph1 [Sporocytophaga myxococcoides]|uniref:histidine kinase n=1 Tax=Sporocytophaga myxococcoides TaxID=153721 RepID=A0A098LJ19_9BACT|nr:ATP-binding protein [Sporocytophaga myxococcoides]GAL86377.1 phytochrome-like protein cph1 [Sporocytophaga myxococcoides]
MEKAVGHNRIPHDSSRKLTKLYILALSALAFLILLGQILIQRALSNQTKDSYIVNMSGRQRMLSQKICKLCLSIERSPDSLYRAETAQKLRAALAIWSKFHQGLRWGDTSVNLPVNTNHAVELLFEEADTYFNEMYNKARNISSVVTNRQWNSNLIHEDIETILLNETSYLYLMDSIVKEFEKEARLKVLFLKKIEMILFVITFLVLVLEGLFIFRPAVQKISEVIADLTNKEMQLTTLNSQLEIKINERTKELFEKNQELEMKNKQLDKINKDLDNFVYTASHDLKAPIKNIEALFNLLKGQVPETQSKANEITEMMDESIDKFKDVLSELGYIGKAQGEIETGTEKVAFKDVMEEIKLTIKDQVQSSGALITEDFKAAPEISFSLKNLRSILFNLLSNAIKYRDPQRPPMINISTKKIKDYIVLQVTDNGMGIKENEISEIFNMYKRLHNHVEGSGVGMSIVKRILDNNGGKIEVKSKVGVGSTFNVYFRC